MTTPSGRSIGSFGTQGVVAEEKVTLPETNSSHLKIGRTPKGNDRIPTIHFQGRTVSFREGRLELIHPPGFLNCNPFWRGLNKLHNVWSLLSRLSVDPYGILEKNKRGYFELGVSSSPSCIYGVKGDSRDSQ